ncbi:MAG: hypothetical protein AAGG09_03380 [Pseudomonadota bacterium]
MTLTAQQQHFVTRYLKASVGPEDSDPGTQTPGTTDAAETQLAALREAEAAVANARAAWRDALRQTLGPAVQLAKQLRADPDPIGADLAEFFKACLTELKSPVESVADAQRLEGYLSTHSDIQILEAENPYGTIRVKEPLLSALQPLKTALAAT